MTALARRTLGRTGLEVTTLGYGAMELGFEHRNIADRDATALLHAVLDAGINLIDTSPDYGRSEDLIGQAIAHRRDEFVLASKCGCVPGAPIGTEHVHSAANVRAGVEASLRRLRTDHLDIVQFHRSITDAELRADGALDELLRLRDEGKVRFIGMSGTLPNLVEQIAMGVFDVFQIPWSVLQPEHEAVIAAASEAGAGILIRGGVARGTPADWDARSYYMVASDVLKARWERARLDELAQGMSRMEFTLRYTLSNPHLDTTIVGTADSAHLADNLRAALAGPLDTAVVAEAARRVRGGARMSPSVECVRLPEAPFGAQIVGEVAEVLALDAGALRSWLAQHHLLVWNTALDVAQNRAVVSRLGRVLPQGPRVVLNERPPLPQPEVIYVSNEREDGALANDELAMHHEFAFLPVPVAGLTLYAEHVVPSSVGTRFVSGALAYAALPGPLRDRIDRLQGLFVAQYDRSVRKVAGRHRDHLVDPTFPRAVHPLVVLHPVTGTPVLYVNNTQVDRVLGFGDTESEALLAELWSFIYRPEHSYEHRYRSGDLVIWDNLALQHGRGANDPAAPRTLRRFLFGERAPWEEWPNAPAGG